MSGIATAASAVGFAKGELQSIFAQNPRSMIWPLVQSDGQPVTNPFGGPGPQITLTSYVTMTEEGRDELELTKHPVDTGSTISDHAYRLPSTLSVKLMWSPASANQFGWVPFSGLGTALTSLGGGVSSYLQNVYAQLITLQRSRGLATVATGKRTYTNMLPVLISVTTDEETENVLSVTINFEEVLRASTTLAQQAPINSSAQANPQATTPSVSQGAQQLTPATPTTTIT